MHVAAHVLLSAEVLLHQCLGSEHVHPGYPAVHVTRLHRYDHSGMSAMLEAEALWSLDDGSHNRQIRREGQNSRTKRFVQLSPRQQEALQRHHKAMMVQIGAHTEHDTALGGGKMGIDISSGPASMRMTRHRYHGRRNDDGAANPVAERLSSLDSQYVGPIGVGTVLAPRGCSPPEGQSLLYVPSGTREASSSTLEETACHVEDQSQVWVVFDTGSTNLWVASDLCKSGPCVKPGRKRYDHTESTSFEAPREGLMLNIEFGTGKISGPQAIDDFHIGPFTVYNQTFGMIQTQDGKVFDEVPFEGILGLAFPQMSANGVTPFFDSIIHQHALKKNEFAFYFSPDNPAANAVFWGGVDKKMYRDKLEYYNTTDPYYWSLPLLAFKIGGTELLGQDVPEPDGWSFLQDGQSSSYGKPKAIVDTGTTFFTAEGDLFETIMDRLPSTSCNTITEHTHPDITYRLLRADGTPKNFVLTNTQYMTASGSGDDLYCSPAFMKINIPAKHGPAMVLGEVFLRHFFSVFDRANGHERRARIGFAAATSGLHVEKHLKDITKNQPAFTGARAAQ